MVSFERSLLERIIETDTATLVEGNDERCRPLGNHLLATECGRRGFGVNPASHGGVTSWARPGR
jgi:hypothetical protein